MISGCGNLRPVQKNQTLKRQITSNFIESLGPHEMNGWTTALAYVFVMNVNQCFMMCVFLPVNNRNLLKSVVASLSVWRLKIHEKSDAHRHAKENMNSDLSNCIIKYINTCVFLKLISIKINLPKKIFGPVKFSSDHLEFCPGRPNDNQEKKKFLTLHHSSCVIKSLNYTSYV